MILPYTAPPEILNRYASLKRNALLSLLRKLSEQLKRADNLSDKNRIEKRITLVKWALSLPNKK